MNLHSQKRLLARISEKNAMRGAFKTEKGKTNFSFLDATLILALITAYSFVAGYMERVCAASRLGIPSSLMPGLEKEEIILRGGRYLVFLLAISVALYFLFMDYIVKRDWFAKQRMRVKQYPHAFFVLMVLAGFALSYALPRFMPFPYWNMFGKQRLNEPDDCLDLVSSPVFSDSRLAAEFEGKSFRFMWKKEGMFVLQEKSTKRFLLVKEDQILSMMLGKVPPK